MKLVNITDEDVIQFLWPGKICMLNRKENIPEEFITYLSNRFKYSESLYESLYCIKYHIDRDNMICPVCGKGILKFNGSKKRGIFNRGCCNKCSMHVRQEHTRKSCKEKYGVEYTLQVKEIRDRIKQTNIEKYGGASCACSPEVQEKIKQSNLKKYGVEYSFQAPEVQEKIKQSNLKKYGVEYSVQAPEVQEKHRKTLMEKYGVTNSFLIPAVQESFKLRKDEIQEKRDETKRKNGTFGKSDPEDKTYVLLKETFGENDIIRNHKDKKLYNHKCDFYIKSIDTWIECNYFWTHGGHFYDETNEQDIETLAFWKEQSKTSNFYKDAIKTWTKRDIQKRMDAIKNHLNYLVFWSYEETEEWVKQLNS